jgi:DNA repair exonuclease SbcCD nuclease subunit
MAKYILCADLHIRSSRPQYRIDNFGETVLYKLKFIVWCANKHNAHIIIAGDIFDNIKIGTRVINRVIRILKKCKNKVYAVPGQHDMEMHGEDLLPSPYLTLVEAGVIIDVSGTTADNVCGIKWEGNYWIPAKINDKMVMVVHHTITPQEPPFFLKDSAMSADDLMEKLSPFNYIVCGDYHSPHTKIKKNVFGGRQVLINCGSLTRSSKDQYDYQPCIYLLDTAVSKFKKIKVPIKPAEEVFRIPKDTKAEDAKLSEHIANIIELTKAEGKPDFITTVKVIMKDEEFSDKQRNLALKYYEEVRNA